MDVIVLATRNAGKIREFSALMAGLGIEVKGLGDFPDVEDVEETGTTFEENALLKARAVSQATGLTAVADDSGICVDALGGAPGVYSARYAGGHGDAEANNAKLLLELTNVPGRKAHGAVRLRGGGGAAGRGHAHRARGVGGPDHPRLRREVRLRLRPDLLRPRTGHDRGPDDAGTEERPVAPGQGPAGAHGEVAGIRPGLTAPNGTRKRNRGPAQAMRGASFFLRCGRRGGSMVR
jgi:Xanthosine triphosphate pyrophosphatase